MTPEMERILNAHFDRFERRMDAERAGPLPDEIHVHDMDHVRREFPLAPKVDEWVGVNHCLWGLPIIVDNTVPPGVFRFVDRDGNIIAETR